MSIFQKVKKFFVKYFPLTAVSRNATLLLIKINFAGLANKYYRAAKIRKSKAWQKIEHTWEDLGGNKDTLYNAVKQGMRVEYKHHPNRHKEKRPVWKYDGDVIEEFYEADNFEPVSTSAAAASASPIILKFAKILKESGIVEQIAKGLKSPEKQIQETGQEFLQKAAKEHVKRGGKVTIKNGKQYVDLGNGTDKNFSKLPDNKMLIIVVVLAIVVLLSFQKNN